MNFNLFSKSKIITISICIAVFIIGFIYSPIVFSQFQKPKIGSFPKTFSFYLNPLNHFRQSLNNCGSYSVAGVLNVFDSELVDPEKIASSIAFKFQDRFTLPVGLESYLKDKNMKIDSANAIGLSTNEKIDYIKSQVSRGKVGVLLVKIANSPWYYLHYITLLGYDDENFYIYDSLAPRDGNSKFTIDLNGPQAGNKSIPAKELIQIWDTGNILNYPKNYNLFVEPNNN